MLLEYESVMCPDVHQAQHGHWAREGVVPSALCYVASTPALEGYKATTEHSKEV